VKRCHPLLERLVQWRAYDTLKNRMRERGYLLHDCYARLIAHNSNTSLDLLEKYWREAAQEHVTSAGKNNPTTRLFPVVEAYRSPYLDSLADSLPESDSKSTPELPLLPSLREFAKRRYENGVSEYLSDQMEGAKFSEYADTVPSNDPNLSTKHGQFEAFSVIAKKSGFKRDKNSLLKNSGNLRIRIVADLGSEKSPVGIQFSTQIFDDRDPSVVFRVHAHKILPRMEYYTVSRDTDSEMHCLNAFCIFRDELFQSFEIQAD
jgi:hypothetical protein